MPVVVIKYSVPTVDNAELLDGTLNTEILGWKHFALTLQTHVRLSDLPAAQTRLAPAGYYLIEHPQITQDPPKVRLFQISSVAVKFSATQENFAIERTGNDPTYTGKGGVAIT